MQNLLGGSTASGVIENVAKNAPAMVNEAKVIVSRSLFSQAGFASVGLLAKINLVATAGYVGYKIGGYLDRKFCLSDRISDYWRAQLDPRPEGVRIYSSPEEFKKTQTFWYNLGWGGL
jgi:hypothetical protein